MSYSFKYRNHAYFNVEYPLNNTGNTTQVLFNRTERIAPISQANVLDIIATISDHDPEFIDTVRHHLLDLEDRPEELQA